MNGGMSVAGFFVGSVETNHGNLSGLHFAGLHLAIRLTGLVDRDGDVHIEHRAALRIVERGRSARHVQPLLTHGLTDPAVPLAELLPDGGQRGGIAQGEVVHTGEVDHLDTQRRTGRHFFQVALQASEALFEVLADHAVHELTDDAQQRVHPHFELKRPGHPGARFLGCEVEGREGRAFVHEAELLPDHLPIDHLDELHHALPDILVVGLPLHRCADAGFRPFEGVGRGRIHIMPGRPAVEVVEVVHISKDFLFRLVDDRSPFHMDLRREHKTNSGNDQQEDRDGDQDAFEDFHDCVANKVEGDNVVIFL